MGIVYGMHGEMGKPRDCPAAPWAYDLDVFSGTFYRPVRMNQQ